MRPGWKTGRRGTFRVKWRNTYHMFWKQQHTETHRYSTLRRRLVCRKTLLVSAALHQPTPVSPQHCSSLHLQSSVPPLPTHWLTANKRSSQKGFCSSFFKMKLTWHKYTCIMLMWIKMRRNENGWSERFVLSGHFWRPIKHHDTKMKRVKSSEPFGFVCVGLSFPLTIFHLCLLRRKDIRHRGEP